MVIYLDSSALVKLIRLEGESAGLVEWLNAWQKPLLVASALVEVEVPRALRRAQPTVLGAVPGVLARLYLIEIDAAVRATAGGYTAPALRSLDAIRLATAELLVRYGKPVRGFVTYDKRLAAMAEEAGLPVAAPA